MAHLDRHEEVAALLEPTVATMRETLGEQHQQTLTAMLTLAVAKSHLGRLQEAEEILRRILPGLERTFGREHSQTTVCIDTLTSVLTRQGKSTEADPLLRATGAPAGAGDPQPAQ
jgi:hypothetical protein